MKSIVMLALVVIVGGAANKYVIRRFLPPKTTLLPR
jgi:hypothetical protein